MEKVYNPQQIENDCYTEWEKRNYFAPASHCESFCIMLPPPNVTGNLHMGHAFQQTLIDILTRYHRMQGHNTLWQCGTDHAGIATQMVVERQLQQKQISRHDLGRDKFVEAVWDWKEHSGGNITRQSRRLGTSMDWSRERFTMDEGLSNAVEEVFMRLYDEGLIYRGKRLVNWDPVLHTAISDLEVISEEENGHLWHMRYPLIEPVNRVSYLVVATPRPETMLGDAAVAVHPEDKRYQHLIGKHVQLPLTDRILPIIADGYVDSKFGTGCVKITPAHDFNDYKIGERHNLPKINIFTIDAGINDDAPAAYRGMDRYTARKQIVTDLETQGLLEKIEDHILMVPRGDRSHAVVEPYLTNQWYVKIQPLADMAIAAVENGDIRFIPENWSKTYFEWMRNIEDWCISRQLWWGHRIPAWYDDESNVYVGRDESEVRKKHQLGGINLRQDEDVLDTWFSSALWPFSTLGWPEKTPELEQFYPTQVLVTGFDIIFFWVARMIMMGLKFMRNVPFHEVYIHGLVRDSDGQKMSKSKGNVLDPLDLIDGIDIDTLIEKRTIGLMQPQMAKKIEKSTRQHFPDGLAAYGTDSLRYTFASLATQGRDIRFDVGRIEGYRNFCNKLWNASRFVMMQIEQSDISLTDTDREFGVVDHWIQSRLYEGISACHEALKNYRFDLASQALYEFTWDEYCDWYLEFAKATLNDASTSQTQLRGTLFTLVNVMETLLRALHPFIPFITEALWQRVAPLMNKQTESIMLASYPKAGPVDDGALNEVQWIKLFIMGVRRIRAERDIAPGKKLKVITQAGSKQEQTWLEANQLLLVKIAKLESIEKSDTDIDDAVMALADNMRILVPLADIINPTIETGRLQKTLDKLLQEKESLEKNLNNDNFVQRAPEHVVSGARQRHADIINEIETYQEQLSVISKM